MLQVIHASFDLHPEFHCVEIRCCSRGIKNQQRSWNNLHAGSHMVQVFKRWNVRWFWQTQNTPHDTAVVLHCMEAQNAATSGFFISRSPQLGDLCRSTVLFYFCCTVSSINRFLLSAINSFAAVIIQFSPSVGKVLLHHHSSLSDMLAAVLAANQ